MFNQVGKLLILVSFYDDDDDDDDHDTQGETLPSLGFQYTLEKSNLYEKPCSRANVMKFESPAITSISKLRKVLSMACVLCTTVLTGASLSSITSPLFTKSQQLHTTWNMFNEHNTDPHTLISNISQFLLSASPTITY